MTDPSSSDATGAGASERGLSAPRVGDLLGGKYVIVRLIGEGGMGAVFEAENRITQKRVAIKWLHPDLSADNGAAARLLREAQAASRIRHSNVVDVYDVEREGNTIFLVMELLEGETLTHALARRDLPVYALIALLVPAMRGVAAAHRQGVVHRDVKPDNIFLAREEDSPRPVAKVLDFGISKLEERGRAQPSLTRTGSAVGTPLYMSYEQLSGDRAIDGRADVYAFGVILYEALTGKLPFDANSLPKLVVKVATQLAVPPKELCPELPESLSRLVLRALARQRDERTPSMDALIAELAPFTSEQGYLAELARPSASADPHASTAPALPVESIRPTPEAPGRARTEQIEAQPSDASRAASSERPFPFLGRTAHRERFVPLESGVTAELRARSLPTPPRATLNQARPHSLRNSILAALTISAAAALVWRGLHPRDRALEQQGQAASAPAAVHAPPALPKSPATRSAELAGDDDWAPERRVQVLGAEEENVDAAALPTQPLAAPPVTSGQETFPVARPRRAQRAVARAAETDAAAASIPNSVTPPAAPVPVPKIKAAQESATPFRVRPPRSEDF